MKLIVVEEYYGKDYPEEQLIEIHREVIKWYASKLRHPDDFIVIKSD